jgi:hypothetical protein
MDYHFVFALNRIFKNVVKHFVEDARCEVHQTVLGIREGKEGWFEMFCLGGIACDDDGEMFSLMVCLIHKKPSQIIVLLF